MFVRSLARRGCWEGGVCRRNESGQRLLCSASGGGARCRSHGMWTAACQAVVARSAQLSSARDGIARDGTGTGAGGKRGVHSQQRKDGGREVSEGSEARRSARLALCWQGDEWLNQELVM